MPAGYYKPPRSTCIPGTRPRRTLVPSFVVMSACLIGRAGHSAPPSLDASRPAAGKRVRITSPEYAGTDIYHTIYLPTNWQPGHTYPVIVEYPPNQYARGDHSFSGSVNDTQLGYYQSGGEGFIWVSMPFIDTTPSSPREARTWWGNGEVRDPQGEALSAEYTRVNMPRILDQFGGDPASVFVTGFSRGAIATGYIALRDPEIADIWLGFLPHSHHDGGSFTPDPDRSRVRRIANRASFITYGDTGLDGGSSNSQIGARILRELGFPVEEHELPGEGHTDEWIEDDRKASSLHVRQLLRQWLRDTIANKPGTSSVIGSVTDRDGAPLAGVRIASGATHWTFSDHQGKYHLRGLLPGERNLVASLANYSFIDRSRSVYVPAEQPAKHNFVALPEPSLCQPFGIVTILLVTRRRRPAPSTTDSYKRTRFLMPRYR